jgi:ribonuclease HII
MPCCRPDRIVAGIDEAGRGPLAGPVVSSCVVWNGLPATRAAVNDSKLLSETRRRALYPWIMGNAFRVGIGIATTEEIDSLNIFQASLLSMERAFEDAGVKPDALLVDGIRGIKGFPESRPVVRGDRKCFFVASASIVAKVVRDGIMDGYHALYPGYGFDRHKGYPTAAHKAAIARFGITPIHRRTFKGVKEYCRQ